MMEQKQVDTYTATIYLGLRERYSEVIHTKEEVEKVSQDYCNRIGFCVTLTDTNFIYKDGREPGVALGIINYPRFQRTKQEIREKALDLAGILKETFNQNRVSIVFSDITIMLE
jgi:hypothetical protein